MIAELLDPRAFGHHQPRQLTVIEHHLAHAASAFHASGYREAAVLVVDGSGDGISTTLARSSVDGLEVIRRWPFGQSLGWFYETVAEHLGLGDWTSAGKLMSLAGYDTASLDLPFLEPVAGGYELDLSRYDISSEETVSYQYADLRYYRRLKAAYAAAYTDLGIPPHRRARSYDRRSGRTSPTQDIGPHMQTLPRRPSASSRSASWS